jgi:hypothetical protein
MCPSRYLSHSTQLIFTIYLGLYEILSLVLFYQFCNVYHAEPQQSLTYSTSFFRRLTTQLHHQEDERVRAETKEGSDTHLRRC